MLVKSNISGLPGPKAHGGSQMMIAVPLDTMGAYMSSLIWGSKMIEKIEDIYTVCTVMTKIGTPYIIEHQLTTC